MIYYQIKLFPKNGFKLFNANLSIENAIYDLVEGVLKSDYLLKISFLII